MLGFAISDGRWLAPDDARALVMSSSLAAQDSSYRVGATVPLIVGGRLASWTIVGIAKAGPSPAAFASREAVAAAIGDARVDRAVARLAPHDDETDPTTFGTIQLLRGSLVATGFAVSNSQLVDENRRVIEDHLLMVAQFLGAMAWLMIVVGRLALASTMSLSVLERTREIGVLRAIWRLRP